MIRRVTVDVHFGSIELGEGIVDTILKQKIWFKNFS